MPYSYPYPRAALTVDCAVVASHGGQPHVLLIQRDKPPSEGAWALPGGFLELDETLADAARRELREETSVTVERVQQLGTYDAIDRDPRERVLSVLHLAVLDGPPPAAKAADDARSARWFPLSALPELAFDHAAMLESVQKHLAGVRGLLERGGHHG